MLTASFFTPDLDWRGPRCVSIARSAPARYRGRRYPALAPSAGLLTAYRAGEVSRAGYTALYQEQVLAHLDPAEVYRQLGEDAILLCWERAKPSFFCHRRLVAEWLGRELGIEVPEMGGYDGAAKLTGDGLCGGLPELAGG